MSATADSVADAMFEMVKDYHGKRKLKAMDLTKAMIEKFGDATEGFLCPTQWAETLSYKDDFWGTAADYDKLFGHFDADTESTSNADKLDRHPESPQELSNDETE